MFVLCDLVSVRFRALNLTYTMWWWKVPVFEKVTPRNLAWLVYERGCDFSASKKMGMDSISLCIVGFP